MNFVKRVLLFLLTNILIVITVSFVTNALGVYGYLNEHGLDYKNLAILCLVWGMTSSTVALWMSRWVAKVVMRVQVILPEMARGEQLHLLEKVHHLARRAGLEVMPEVGIYEGKELNAFATGPTKNRALVAVSSGLLEKMHADEVEGVLAHEISHINNGDMVTMTLLQGIINAFIMFLSRVIAYTLSQVWRNSASSGDTNHYKSQTRFIYHVSVFMCDIMLTLLGSLVVAAFSRYREYRADKGGAILVGRYKMIGALERLRSEMTHIEDTKGTSLEALKISQRNHRFLSLFSTHPDINLRIEALKI